MNMSENDFRDLIYQNYSESFSSLIVNKRSPISWDDSTFPSIGAVLQQVAERKINRLISGLDSLCITNRELCLKRTDDTTTRIDLYGNSEENGITIIELKKSKQTERQAFTELLGYSNHFCSLFPGASESCMNSILVAPMENRVVRDAYVQELLINKKNIVSLIPRQDEYSTSLSVYYPASSYYSWFEKNIFNDSSMSVVAISFPVIEGWIDTDLNSEDGSIPSHTKSALNKISSAISARLESENFHSFVYASQKWGEVATAFPFPNTIFVVCINPFSYNRTYVNEEGEIIGDSATGRLEEIQELHAQIEYGDMFWVETLETAFREAIIRAAKEEFERCLMESGGSSSTRFEISTPDWWGIKTSAIDAVFVHNLDVYPTGLIREIYSQYLEYSFSKGFDPIHFSDDLPKFLYKAQQDWFAIWQILQGIGLGDEAEDD